MNVWKIRRCITTTPLVTDNFRKIFETTNCAQGTLYNCLHIMTFLLHLHVCSFGFVTLKTTVIHWKAFQFQFLRKKIFVSNCFLALAILLYRSRSHFNIQHLQKFKVKFRKFLLIRVVEKSTFEVRIFRNYNLSNCFE